jgi:hypothetical protein
MCRPSRCVKRILFNSLFLATRMPRGNATRLRTFTRDKILDVKISSLPCHGVSMPGSRVHVDWSINVQGLPLLRHWGPLFGRKDPSSYFRTVRVSIISMGRWSGTVLIFCFEIEVLFVLQRRLIAQRVSWFRLSSITYPDRTYERESFERTSDAPGKHLRFPRSDEREIIFLFPRLAWRNSR